MLLVHVRNLLGGAKMRFRASDLILVLAVACHFIPATFAQGPYRSLGDVFQHQLAGFAPEAKTGRAPSLGGSNPGHCCLLAVNESLQIVNGYLSFKPGQTSLRGNVSSFLRYQFPCGAEYNGSRGDQPQVWKSYSWCHENCPGWKLSSTKQLSAWVQPFVQYIVPAIIFVLSIPRRRRLNVPDRLFPRRFNAFPDGFSMFYKVPTASIIVTLDTIIWLIVVLAMSGPLLLSGAFEALLDLRLLYFIDDRKGSKSLSVQDKAYTLFTILLGNLDEDPAWEDLVHVTNGLPTETLRRPNQATIIEGRPAELRKATLGSPSVEKIVLSRNGKVDEESYDVSVQHEIRSIKTKLSSMLECQRSFGSTVGAPIVFFTGSFIYTLIEIEANYGDKSVDPSFIHMRELLGALAIIADLFTVARPII